MHQVKGRGMCLGTGREAKDVGISTRRGARCACPLSRARGVCKVSATCDGDGVSETDGSLVLPEILRQAPGEGIVPGSSIWCLVVTGALFY